MLGLNRSGKGPMAQWLQLHKELEGTPHRPREQQAPDSRHVPGLGEGRGAASSFTDRRKTARPTLHLGNVCPWGITSLITDNCCTQESPCWASEAWLYQEEPSSARSPVESSVFPGPRGQSIRPARGTAEAFRCRSLQGCCGSQMCFHPGGSPCIKLKQDRKSSHLSQLPAKLEEVTGENYAFQWQAVSWKLCFELVCRE